ncbi:MAG: class I SAM-dependent methyltransferase [Hyphomicrobium sp.]|nr:class I SAM-dependent methyltransferase [Hyphomicrobium sp.]
MPTAADHRLTAAYENKPDNYYSSARKDFLALLPDNSKAAILELGCGEGPTGALALKQGKCAEYVGIELMPEAAAAARLVLTRVIYGDVERTALDLPAAHFDALIISEVLEHLINPWDTLQNLGTYLKPGALVLASSPNVAHWKIVRQLINGRFDLTDAGIMDRTHLRWFTPATYAALFEKSGYTVERVWPITTIPASKRLLATLIGGRHHLFYKQICIAARKP